VTGWLIDTSVLSAFAPERPSLQPAQAAWFEERASALFLSTITAMEIETGIAKLRRAGSTHKLEALRLWFDEILRQYAERVLPFDLAAAQRAGALNDTAQAGGRHPGLADIAIAAIAQVHELVVLTTNIRHFEPLGVSVLNPFAVSD
jgi:predicted nucleic acid-binding protein